MRRHPLDGIGCVINLGTDDIPNPGKLAFGRASPLSGPAQPKFDRLTIGPHPLWQHNLSQSHLNSPKLRALNSVHPLRGDPMGSQDDFAIMIKHYKSPPKSMTAYRQLVIKQRPIGKNNATDRNAPTRRVPLPGVKSATVASG
jgi:hypothetical protein